MALQGNRLMAADTANNRILFWQLPLEQAYFSGAQDVIGQIDFESYGENHWQSVSHEFAVLALWNSGIRSSPGDR